MTDRIPSGAAFARPSLFPLKPPLARLFRALLLVAWRMKPADRARPNLRLDLDRLSDAHLRDIGLDRRNLDPRA